MRYLYYIARNREVVVITKPVQDLRIRSGKYDTRGDLQELNGAPQVLTRKVEANNDTIYIRTLYHDIASIKILSGQVRKLAV